MISLIFILLAGLFNGLMDRLSFRFDTLPLFIKKRSSYWDPKISWVNKYESKIPFAKTFLVSLTDGWHLVKMLMKVSIMISVISYVGKDGFWLNTPILRMILDYSLLYIFFQIGFTLSFRKWGFSQE